MKADITEADVADKPGLREQHKQRTREAIGQAAMSLFFEHGYDFVTVADVAQHAGVSPATVFNYYNVKEDLFFDEVAELQADMVAAVRACRPGGSVLTSLRRQVVYQLTAGRPESASEEVVRFHRMIAASEDLQRREQQIQLQRREVLAEALAEALGAPTDALLADLSAALYLAAEAVIATRLRAKLLAGQPLPEALRELSPLINEVFNVLRSGIGPLDKAKEG